MAYILASIALDPAARFYGMNPRPPQSSIDASLDAMGVNPDVPILVRLWHWLTNLFTQFSLGTTVGGAQVTSEIAARSGASLRLLLIGSIIGVGVVLGIMAFGFFGLRAAVAVGALASAAMVFVGYGFLRDYATLSGSLVAYAVSFLVCWGMSVRSRQDFDFDRIARVTGDFDPTADDAGDRPVAQPAGARAS